MRIGYSRSQILLHWLIAALVVLQWFSYGGVAEVLGNALESSSVDRVFANPWPAVHAGSGALIFIATVASLALSWRQGRPPPDTSVPPLLRTLEWLVRVALYLTLLALPVTGALSVLADPGLAGLHRRLSGLLFFLALIHLVLMAWHLARRDEVFVRMLLPEEPQLPAPPSPLTENAIVETPPKAEPPSL